jgi:RNA polymerase sigma factor (TIGR02999 family)
MKERATRGLGDRKIQAALSTLEDERRLDLDHLFSVAYEELHRIARSVKYSGPDATISPSTLVNEAWLRLRKSPKLTVCSELHFKHIAAQAMRRVLVEAARRRWAQKRGGSGSAIFVAFDDSIHAPVASDQDLLALDAALEELKSVSPRQSMLVQIRFFGGLGVAQAAELLRVSESTVLREWRTAKAWLASQILRKR